MAANHSYEYEERAFFEEKDLARIQHALATLKRSRKSDNKTSYFFVLPDINVSIATSPYKTVVKYKGGQLGRNNGFIEHEFAIAPEALSEALALFSSLLKVEPQVSEQFRLNYNIGNSIEVALKYTYTWGFHLEFEKIYTADETDKYQQEVLAHRELADVAQKLGVQFIDDATMEAFKQQCARNVNRGEYEPDTFRAKYGQEFSA